MLSESYVLCHSSCVHQKPNLAGIIIELCCWLWNSSVLRVQTLFLYRNVMNERLVIIKLLGIFHYNCVQRENNRLECFEILLLEIKNISFLELLKTDKMKNIVFFDRFSTNSTLYKICFQPSDNKICAQGHLDKFRKLDARCTSKMLWRFLPCYFLFNWRISIKSS